MQNSLNFYHKSLPALKIFFDTINEPVSYHLYECLADEASRYQPTYLWGSEDSGIQVIFKAISYYFQSQGFGVEHYTATTFSNGLKNDEKLSDEKMKTGQLEHKILIVQDIDRYTPEHLRHILGQIIYNQATSWYWILFSGSQAADKLIMRDDLRSRILAGFVYHLQDLSWSVRQSVVEAYIQYLGLTMRPEIMDYLYKYYSRGLTQLLDAIDTIDRYTKASSHKITATLIQQILPQQVDD